MKKWFSNPLPSDAAAGSGQASRLKMKNGSVINAADDFRAQQIEIEDNATKTGSGTLSALQISQTEYTFTLDEGTLALDNDLFSEDEYITGMPSPWMHIDASDYANSMQTSVDSNGTISVTVWSDINTNGFTATAPEYCTPPTLVTNGLNGLPFVDFGALVYQSTNASHLLWNTTNGNMRTVVMVYSDNPNYTYYTDGRDLRPCFLGRMTGDMQFWRGPDGELIYPEHANERVKYGHMAVDGKPASCETYLPAGFHVLSFVTANVTRSEAFARDLDSWTGGCRLAEVMIWNEALSSPQLRSIEQGLMVKWLGRNRPGYPFQEQEGPATGAWLHLDASDTNSMELVESEGSLYVQQWNDIRDNGIFAYAGDDSTRPIWQEGNGFPHVDFGVLSGPSLGTDWGQHLFWNQTNSSIRTVFLVLSDADTGLDQNFIGHLSTTPPLNRGLNHTFFHPVNASPYIINGTHSLDYGLVNGVNTPLPSGFHVIGISTYRSKVVEGNAFARHRDSHAGGQKLAEVLIYNRELTDGEFRQTRRYLMNKWFNTDSQSESEIANLTATSDAVLDIGEGQTLSCKNVTTSGTLDKRGAGRLAITSANAENISVTGGELSITDLELSPPCVIRVNATAESMDCINVTGNLTIPADGEVIVMIEDGTKLSGSHTLFTFGSLTGGSNLSSWRATVEDSQTYTVKLVKEENSIDVHFFMSGTLLLLR